MDKKKEIYDEIARVAYALFEKRGKMHGYAHVDWIEAERIVLERHATEIEQEASKITSTKKKIAPVKVEPATAEAVKKPRKKAATKTTEKAAAPQVRKSAPKKTT